MKTLANHTLIYDKDCPLCTTYTQLFVRYGFLDDKGRQAYQDMDFFDTNVDTEIAKNKIALLNTDTKEVIYGIDAMTKVLGNRLPWISFFMKFKPLHWFMTQFYSLISYNRKIVIPVNCNNLTSCNPTQSWFWRGLFIVLCCVPVQMVLPMYFSKYFEGTYINAFYFSESLLFIAQIIFQLIFCKLLKERNVYDYIGHVSFISFMGANFLGLFYIMLKIVEKLGLHTGMLGMVCYGIVVGWMFLEHRRRMNILGMSSWLTATWLLYRLVIYPLVFSL